LYDKSTLDSSESQLILVQPETNNQIQIEPSNQNLSDLSPPPNLPILGAVAAISILVITLLWRQYQKYFGDRSLQTQVNSGYQAETYGWDNDTWDSDRRESLTRNERSGTKERVFAKDTRKNEEAIQTQVRENKSTFSQDVVEPASVPQAKINQEDIEKEHFTQIKTEQEKIKEELIAENTSAAEDSSKTKQASCKKLLRLLTRLFGVKQTMKQLGVIGALP